MHLGTAALLKFFNQHRDDESLVLVTIIGTEGSTYRKPGAMMLISRDHQYVGMISGGCLEGDLLHHADEVFASGEARKVTYDMHAGDDLVWSLGIGCDGIIHLMLQKLNRQSDFAMLHWLMDAMQQRTPVIMALSVSAGDDTPLGSMAMLSRAGQSMGNAQLVEQATAATTNAWPDWRYRHTDVDSLLVQILPQPCVLICGAGPDAVPVAAQFADLGWECIIADHRAGYADPRRFAEGCRTVVGRPEQLHLLVELEQVNAAVIMAHHLENDAAYLRQLAPHLEEGADAGSLQYLGVLGPAARRDKLREMAGCPDAEVRGPVGLDIGAELPEGIALSIAAEVHAALNRRNGLSLTLKTVS
jgi:xanthine/CO dehydrogenase XdhC/CoxF family maturation factor